MESDHRYYLRRASEERRAAERAITTAARERHGELAKLFAAKAEQRAATRSSGQQASPQRVQLAT